MNNILAAELATYEKEKENIRKKIDANKKNIALLDKELEAVFAGCEKIADRVNARKENKEHITTICNKTAAAHELESVLYTALKVANEMQVKTVTNALRAEIISNPEKWIKYPLHFKKCQDMIKDYLSGSGLSLYNSYGSYYISGCYEYHNLNGYLFRTSAGIITQDIINDMSTKGPYFTIAASDILTECKKAFKARKNILAKYEKAKKEIEQLRVPFSACSTFYDILPYANNSPENYKHL